MTLASDPTTHVDVLILGAGWTSTFLIPLLKSHSISHAATTRTGSDSTIPFTFDPSSNSADSFLALPSATTVLITFPLNTPDSASKLHAFYLATHGDSPSPHILALGTTSIWPTGGSRHTPITPDHARGKAEEALLALGGSVLNLSGLWGGQRCPWNWLGRVAGTKEKLAAKETLHLIHGEDLARAVVAVHKEWKGGERWCLTDLRSYDWWDLAQAWGGEVEKTWVRELMKEKDVKGLPRSGLERRLDAREFWELHGMWPVKSLTMARTESGC